MCLFVFLLVVRVYMSQVPRPGPGVSCAIRITVFPALNTTRGCIIAAKRLKCAGQGVGNLCDMRIDSYINCILAANSSP